MPREWISRTPNRDGGGETGSAYESHSSACILTDEQIVAGAMRIRGRSHRPLEDLALYCFLFVTGARPLEIARLQVRDYLDERGAVRRVSTLREEVAINGRARPLYFRSIRLDEAVDAYLVERVDRLEGLGAEGRYRGLSPDSRLFMSATGRGFEITSYGAEGQRRFRCPSILETYRKLFRYAEFEHITALSARHTVADRLYRRGADEAQVGLLLGISDPSAVRKQYPRRKLPLEVLAMDLV